MVGSVRRARRGGDGRKGMHACRGGVKGHACMQGRGERACMHAGEVLAISSDQHAFIARPMSM